MKNKKVLLFFLAAFLGGSSLTAQIQNWKGNQALNILSSTLFKNTYISPI